MKLKDLLYSSFDGDSLYRDLTRDQILDIDIHIIEIDDDLFIVGSSFNPISNSLDILL